MIFQPGTTVYTKGNQELTIVDFVIKQSTGEVYQYKATLRDGPSVLIKVEDVFSEPQSQPAQRSEYQASPLFEETKLKTFQGDPLVIIGMRFYEDQGNLLNVKTPKQYKVLFEDGRTAFLDHRDIVVSRH